MGKKYGSSSKNRITLCSINPSGYTPKRIEIRVSKRYYTPMFIAALLTTGKRWKQTWCPSTEEWINNTWCIHATEYYSALKKKEILTHTLTKWLLKTLYSVTQASHRKTNTVWFYLHEVTKAVTFRERK